MSKSIISFFIWKFIWCRIVRQMFFEVSKERIAPSYFSFFNICVLFSSETSINLYKIVHRHMKEVCNLHSYGSENFKSQEVLNFLTTPFNDFEIIELWNNVHIHMYDTRHVQYSDCLKNILCIHTGHEHTFLVLVLKGREKFLMHTLEYSGIL